MKSKPALIASFFIASCACFTWAQAENVYKCGSTYSQSPCPGGTLVNVDDARDPQQKAEHDAVTQRDAALAKSMEKTRLANEAKLRKAEAKKTVTKKTKPAVLEPKVIILKAKRPQHKTVKSKDVTVVTPGSAQPPTKKRHSQKTRAASPSQWQTRPGPSKIKPQREAGPDL